MVGLLAVAYLLGGVPFAFLLVRGVMRTDVRDHGSGNAGATNASRLFGARWQPFVFLLIFALDAGKGFVAAAFLPRLFDVPDAAPALAGLAAALGHAYSPFLRFRGGKSVAASLGVFLALEPLATLAGVAAFFLIYALTRTVAAGSLAFALVLPVAVFVHGTAPAVVRFVAVALALLILFRHRSNITRMLSGRQT